MSNSHDIRVTRALGVLLSLSWGCLPIHDLDKAAGGASGSSVQASSASTAIDAGPASGGMGGVVSAASGGTTVDAAEPADVSTGQGGGSTKASAGTTASAGSVAGGAGGRGGITFSTQVGGGKSSTTGSVVGGTAGGSVAGGVTGGNDAGGTGGATGNGGTGPSCSLAPALPDIVNSPVQGEIIYSAGASWDVEGEQVPAFEIHTPSANYWLVKSAAAIVSITDTGGVQWINFSSGFRPNRGVPNLGSCCQPGDPVKLGLPVMTTVVDPSFTITSTHVRLISTSDDGGYRLVWDFFLTHFTLTVDCAERAFAFTFRGVPGGAIDIADRLVLSSGESVSPKSPYSGDLTGEAEWIYYDHTAGKHSLFLIQHTGDAFTDSYQVADGDTPMWSFGGDQSKRYLTQTPLRFSLGLVDSADDAVVSERIRFVTSAIH